MSAATHQTVRLVRGKHADPSRGVCVMELASMLAHEPFSDHPRSVCPVIAGFLRTYNDGVSDTLRQQLYRFASEAVGTRAGAGIEAERAELALRWAQDQQEHLRRGLARLLPPISVHGGADGAEAGTIAARVAVKMVSRGLPGAHAEALALVARMIARGHPGIRPCATATPPVVVQV